MKNRQLTFLCCLLMLAVLAILHICPTAFAEGDERKGAWIDEVVGEVEASPATALRRLKAGDAHVFAFGITDPELYQQVRDSDDLGYERHLGTSSELAFNPSGPVFEGTGELNPFAEPKVREAMNWLVDRSYIAEEIYGGMARKRWLPINSAFSEYARMVDAARLLEERYAHDPDRAEAIITEQMKEMEAEKIDGLWHYEGEPVELRFLIRTEDERREVGDYVAGLLENLGFEVVRDYRDASQASPVWSGADPSEGRFHIYTGAWISTVVRRDDTTTFDFYYTPRGLPSPLWQAYQPAEEFDEIAERLSRKDFSSMEERRELFVRAMELAMEDSVRIWLVDQVSISPRRSEFSIAADLGGGISGAYLWPHTLRRKNEIGGEARIIVPDLLTDPWNPLDGSNWIFDMMFTRATSDYSTITDPYTGLSRPQRLEKAEVVVEEGLPVQRTLDWVSLEFADEITAPGDAWIDWDAEKQEFITVDEKHPEGLTARRKSVAHYPPELYETKWHDGSTFSAADVVIGLILLFDRASEESPLYDEAQTESVESFKRHFRGLRIRSENPLVIETYSDSYNLDAENNVAGWYPNYAHGPGAWHTLGVGILAEKEKKLAFSKDKADKLSDELDRTVEWMSLIAGPSIADGTLGSKLERAKEENYIPYHNVLSKYIDEEEAASRWNNLEEWFENKGHFWVGTGPLYLEDVSPVANSLHMKRFDDFPDPAAKWEGFEQPMMPEVDISGPRSLSPGEEVEFVISVEYDEKPYPVEMLNEVNFMWYDSRDDLVLKGDAEPVESGKWKITLDKEATEELTYGPNRIEAIVVSREVSIPVSEQIEFVVRP